MSETRDALPSGSKFKIAIDSSRYNKAATDHLLGAGAVIGPEFRSLLVVLHYFRDQVPDYKGTVLGIVSGPR